MLLRIVRSVALTIAAVAAFSAFAQPAAAGLTRTFTCSGTAGDVFTAYTVTGQLNLLAVPMNVRVARTGSGVVESSRTGHAALLGASTLHAGFVAWDVTGPNPDDNTYTVHMPRVLPGGGGFFDADLEVAFAGGANGELQIPMFDCTVSGGPQLLSIPGPRSFSCTGDLGEPFTFRTVAGGLSFLNVPRNVRVTQPGSGIVDSSHSGPASSLGPSWLHAGYTAWDITGPNPNGDVFVLHAPPVLPPAGGYFDADLEIQFAGGADGEWQIPMFDCTTRW